MKKGKKVELRKICVFVSVFALFALVFAHSGRTEAFALALSRTPSVQGYAEYLEQHSDKSRGSYGTTEITGLEELTGADSSVTYSFDVPTAGMYNIAVLYRNVPGGGEVTREVRINGELPFREAGHIQFKRYYVDANKDFKTQTGNQSFPRQLEADIEAVNVLRSSDGYIVEPLAFYFKSGENTVTFNAVDGEVYFLGISLSPAEELPSYAEYIAAHIASGGSAVKNTEPIVIQAQDAVLKTSPALYPVNDRTSPLNEPYHPSNIVLNAFGGENWKLPGEFASWEVEVPEAGLYKIAMRYRQSLLSGSFSTRVLTINGEVPFAEAYDLRFHYGTKFSLDYLHNDATGEEFFVYLEAGKNVIGLEASLGVFGDLTRRVRDSLNAVTAIYREIIIITGVSPDKYRDYQLGTLIPDLVPRLTVQKDALSSIIDDIGVLSGDYTESSMIINRLIVNLEKIIERPDRVASFMSDFRISISALGNWISMVQNQPLTIERFIVAPEGYELPKAEAGFFRNVWHGFMAFIGSWTNRYNAVSSVVASDAKTIEVWVSTGRDQFTILQRLVAESFSKEHGINVQLKLVGAEVIFPATLTGNGPDVNIQVAPATPINFGYREGAYDLTQFDDFEEVAKRFLPAAIGTFEYDGACYALPDQMSFPVMFYRTDVFDELGLKVPVTIDEFLEIVPILQKNKMEIYWETTPQTTLGAASASGASMNVNSVYLSLLYQNDGFLYNGNGESTAITNDIGLEVFKLWTDFYTKHSFTVLMPGWVNRFRLGDVPVVIADFMAFNTLSVAAPEIRGNWAMAQIPGTVREDGTVRYDNPVTVSGSLIVKNVAERKGTVDEAWEFLKWWTSDETQESFARDMEAVLGLAGRYPVANLEAFSSIPWGRENSAVLNRSLEWCRTVPQVPGSYLTGRVIRNAFLAVVDTATNKNPLDEIFKAADQLDQELSSKRKEFGLD